MTPVRKSVLAVVFGIRYSLATYNYSWTVETRRRWIIELMSFQFWNLNIWFRRTIYYKYWLFWYLNFLNSQFHTESEIIYVVGRVACNRAYSECNWNSIDSTVIDTASVIFFRNSITRSWTLIWQRETEPYIFRPYIPWLFSPLFRDFSALYFAESWKWDFSALYFVESCKWDFSALYFDESWKWDLKIIIKVK